VSEPENRDVGAPEEVPAGPSRGADGEPGAQVDAAAAAVPASPAEPRTAGDADPSPVDAASAAPDQEDDPHAEDPDEADDPDDPEDPREIVVRAGTVRRAPVYRRFFVVGALLGAVVSVVTSAFGDFASSDQVRALLPMPWGLMIFLAPFGGLLGVVLALVSDRRARRRDE
jgi:hypothetical protein